MDISRLHTMCLTLLHCKCLDSVKWLKVNVEKNLRQPPDRLYADHIKLQKSAQKQLGHVEIMNIDGHDLIRSRLPQLIKHERQNQQIEVLMNLPGGALFFLPTFKGRPPILHAP